MKKKLTLSLIAFLVITQLVNASVFSGNKLLSNINLVKSARDTAPNQIFYALFYPPISGDTSNQFTGAGCQTTFDTSFDSNVYGPYDSYNLYTGFGENISIPQGNITLSIEGRSLPTVKDTIPLLIQGVSTQAYQLQIDATSFVGNGVIPNLYDLYLKKITPLATAVNLYNFTPNADSVATYKNRFGIIFTAPLPIQNISLSSSFKNNSVNLIWNTTGEKNIDNYTLLKSYDGIHYTAVDKVFAKNTNTASYSYTDNNIINSVIYYRIKAISKSGTVSYSSVSVINKNVSVKSFGIYPNPVRNNSINLKFDNISSGNYVLNIYNSIGQKVTSKQISHNASDATYNIILDNSVASGLYKVSLLSTTNSKEVYESNLLIQK